MKLLKEEAEKIIFTEYEEVNSDNEIDKLFEDISEELEIKEEEKQLMKSLW